MPAMPDRSFEIVKQICDGWAEGNFRSRLQSAGDTVVASVIQRGTGEASGIETELPYFVLFTLRGTKVIRIESIKQEQEALAAAGLPTS